MLSRLALQKAFERPQLIIASMRRCSNVAKVSTSWDEVAKRNPTWPPPENNPDRDLVNFPRLDPLKNHPPVVMGFIPASLFDMFYKKTGVTGPYCCFWGVFAFLISKEIIVVMHEPIIGAMLIFYTYLATKKFGTPIKNYLDAQVQEADQVEIDLQQSFLDAKKNTIADYKDSRESLQSHRILNQARLENIGLQLESIYRDRLYQIHKEVKNRLDYHLEVNTVKNRFEHKHMLQWVVEGVRKSITPELEKTTLQQCMNDLKVMAKA